MKGRITKTGYRRNSPDVNNDFNIIPSNRISMRGVDFPVFGVDNMGNSQMMYPGGEYEFQGDYVTELPAYGSGGLTQWFAEKWVDIKTGKECGRSGKDKKGRPYPACRPSKRVNSTTPKTSSEMSASEKAKFKRKKKSGKRIDYNHKRAQLGIEVPKRNGVRKNPDGSVSTHLMATETLDGKNWFSFPTLFQDPDGAWVDMSDRPWEEAYKEAKKRGEVIEFGTDKEAAIKFGAGSWKKQFGGRSGDVFQEVDTYIKPGQNIRPNWAQTPDAVTNYTFGKNLVDDESRFSLGLQGVDILDEIQYRADALGSIGVGVGNRNGKAFRPAGENLRAGIRGQASWQGVPGNVIENMFGRRSALDWRGSVEGEAGLAYANGAVRPYLSFMPQTNIGIGGNMSIGIGAEMRGRYDNKGSLTQKDAYSGMSRGSGRYSLKYDMGDGDFIEGYYAPSDPFFQGETLGVRNVFALESKQPRFGIRLRKSFQPGGENDTPLTSDEIFNVPRTVRYENGKMVVQDKPIYDGMLDEVTVTPPSFDDWMENFRANRATGGLKPVYPIFEVLSAGIKTPATLGIKSLQKGIKNLPAKINPRYFKPNSNMYYRGIGKEGMEDALQSGLFRAKPADKIPARMVDLGSVGKVDMAKRFNNTYYSPQFSIADRYGAGFIAEVPKDIANFRKRYKGSDWSMATKDQIPISEGQILKKDWWSGYKPIKQLGGSLPTYQIQGQTSEDQSGILIPEELDEVTITGEAIKRKGPHGNAFGQFEGYVSPDSGESENLNIPFDFSGLSYKVKGDDHIRIRKPGKLAKQIVDRFETEYGYAPENLYDYALGAFTNGFRGTTEEKVEYGLKPTLKERLFANKKGYNTIWAKDYDFPVSKAGFSNSYYYNPGDSDFTLSYLDLERGNLDEEWGQEKIDFNDVSNMFRRWDPVYQPSLQLNIQGNWNDGPGKSKVTKADIELYNPDYEVATPFVSNLFDYIGSDTYFERVAAGQYANEIDIDKWTTDASYRAGYANRLKSEKPEFLKNHYASLTDQFKDGIDVRDTRYSNASLGSWASSSTSEAEGEGTKLYVNPTLFSKGKTREEVTKEVTQALRHKNVSPYTAEYTRSGKMQPEEFDEALKNPNSALAQAQKMLVDAAMETSNFDWRNTIGHELGHSVSMSRAKSLYRDGLAFDNNDPSAYTNDYELLYGMNNLTSGKDFYSLQDHVDAGLEPYTYLNTLDKKLDSQAADIGAEYHLISPEEIIGDIHGIRSYNQRVNKVNPKDQFTKENLETLLNDEKFKESLMYKRMQERYGDDQSKWMKAMNLIAVNEDKKSNTMYAQTGGQQGPPYMTEGPVQELVYPGRQEGPQDVLTENISRTGKLGNATKPAAPSVDVDRLRKGIKYAESLGGKLMMNPESSATGFYGQLFSEIEGKDFLQGISRQQFANDTTLQNKVFDERLAGNEGLFGKKTGLVQDGLDLYNEYKPQLGDKLTYTPTEIAALTNMLGRQGTREYLGYVLRDGKSLEEALPNLYGSSAKYKNKTPDQYIQKFNEAFGEGGENIPVYNTYSSKNRAWLAARKNLGRGKKFMYGGKVYSTNTPKGL